MPAGGPAGHSRVAPRPQQCVPWQPKASRSTCAAGQQASLLARAELRWGVQGAAVAAVAAQYAGVLAVLGLLVRSTVLKLHDLVSSFPSWVDARPYVQVRMRSAAQRSAARNQVAQRGSKQRAMEGGKAGRVGSHALQAARWVCGVAVPACALANAGSMLQVQSRGIGSIARLAHWMARPTAAAGQHGISACYAPSTTNWWTLQCTLIAGWLVPVTDQRGSQHGGHRRHHSGICPGSRSTGSARHWHPGELEGWLDGPGAGV